MSPSSDQDRPSTDRDGVISPLRFLSGGLEFAVTCLAAALAGKWLDGRLGTEPWFTAGLLILAFATATWLLLRSLSRTGGNADQSNEGKTT
ncbi:MAG TPA: AtpZ/AtpI family protein [Acidimicrobiales bacterium]|nr:AtpZ/AtpI family protein [Acidimicrobiales bacterium]